MPSHQQKLTLRRQEGASKETSAKANDVHPPSPPMSDTIQTATTEQMAKDIASIYVLLKETSETQESKLNAIQTATRAVEAKLADMVTRISNAESRLDFLEDASRALKENPPATSDEVNALRQKLDDIENRGQRNNLRFAGFPEGCEGSDALAFVRNAIPQLLKVDFPGGLEIDRAHRSLVRRKPDGHPPRVIIARFLRFQDREQIMEAARRLGQLNWNGHRIMIFPDYSKLVTDKRAAFNPCKRLLHERKIKFSLLFPAVLVLKMTEGRREFTDPKKAQDYILSLP
uniref:L1 transposable element RRM domain-containing protein n=1 Tax=Astatotilapia calliptera TaxID=8154 RepID=A0A3P8PYG8_ASTCA